MKAKQWRWAVVCGALAVPAVTYAGDSGLHAREVGATRMYTGADQVARSDGYYAQARDAFSTGSGSVVALATDWEKDAKGWVDGWLRIFAMADLDEDVPFEEFQRRLAEAMEHQASGLEGLRAAAGAIEEAAAEARRLLDSGPMPDVPDLADYREVIDGLRAREGELRDAIGDVGAIAASRLAVLDDMSGKSRVIILAHVKAALIARARYPLDRAVAAVQEYLAAEAIVDPIVARVAAAENRIDALTMGLASFQADDAIAASRTQCTDARVRLVGVSGAEAYVRASRGRVETLCAAMEDHYEALASAGGPRSRVVFQYLKTARGQIHELCWTASPPVSCEKLAVLAALERADLDAMDDAHLRFVEVGFARALDAARRKARAT
jgi:hypothetical protein